MPFNWKSPIGYVFATIFISVSSFSILLCLTLTLSFLIGNCWLFISFAKDISSDWMILDFGGRLYRRHPKVKKRIYEIVQLHSDVKQLSDNEISSFDRKKKWCKWTSISFFLTFFCLVDLLIDSIRFMNLSYLAFTYGCSYPYRCYYWYYCYN